jgi:hypothetical protein
MTNEKWLAFAPRGSIGSASSPCVHFGGQDFVCVGSGATRDEARKDAEPYAHVRLYENVLGERVPKLVAGNDGSGWFQCRG